MGPGAHTRDVTGDFKESLSLRPGAAGGGLYWCDRHTRMHVCGPGRCKSTFKTSMGFEGCVLSGQTVEQAVEFAYGGGVAILSAAAASQRAIDRTLMRSAKPPPETPLDAVIRHAGPKRPNLIDLAPYTKRPARTAPLAPPRETETPDQEGRGRGAGGREGYQDLDAPADDLFPDDGEGNTFRDGLGKDLLVAYTQAYVTVHHIIFSGDRAALEAATEQERSAEALQKIRQYAVDRRKAGLPVDLTVCKQLQDCALSKSKRLYCRLLVPPHGICRMKAYYAAVCMEFFIQLTWQLTLMVETTKLPLKIKQAFERFLAFNIADVAPNILDIMHEGLKIHKHIIVPAEPLFHDLFPESLTLDKLGIRQKTCTEVKKLLKRCVLLVVEAKRPLSALQTTQLDMNSVLRDLGDPVLSLFFRARRLRLAGGAEGG
jgi:hypothetical protein